MGHSASTNRWQPRMTEGTLDEEPTGAATAARGSYAPVPLQALSMSRERPDMAFMTNDGVVPMSTGLPELHQTCSLKNHVNLEKKSLKLRRSSTNPSQYALEFQFDATQPCRIRVYVVAVETVAARSGNSSISLVHADKIPILTQHFPRGLGQTFVLRGDGKEEKRIEKDLDGFECPPSRLDFSVYDTDELIYQANGTQFPLVIVLEVDSERECLQSQSTFCSFFQTAEDNWNVRLLKQKVLVDGLTYELQEIYGISASVDTAPPMEQNDVAENHKTTTSHAASAGTGLPQEAECIICLCEPRTTTILPCRHMCLCSMCAETISRSCSMCPICRTRVEALLQMRAEVKEANAQRE
ncbi:unnamed protein product [Hyaloperonospora brassicae]|uniref:RING-type E3 ubiquitin transferase n=1 Tax=Hyaloperonospora brassicae TaxID=162125 RepID=A0AAV0SWH3_HYABA|nr:unnamed protein product [Hyaloperonospora brassicae]